MISKTTYARKPLAGNITLQTVKLSYENNMMPGDKSFKAGTSGDPVGYKNHGFHR
jgi:hypothetical protein